MTKILIIDDEKHILELLKINLEAEDYIVETWNRGDMFLQKCLEFKPDLILLDIMLPGIDGLSICKEIKTSDIFKNIGIILISAKIEEDIKIKGLDIGADDYITKPFSIREVLSRVNALVRRLQPLSSIDEVYSNRNITYDFKNKILYKEEIPLELTNKEIKLIELLIKNKGKILTREFILEKIWNKEVGENSGRSLDVYIRKLRGKIDDNPNISLIETIHGKGYKFI